MWLVSAQISLFHAVNQEVKVTRSCDRTVDFSMTIYTANIHNTLNTFNR